MKGLAEARKAKGLTQEQVCEKLGIKPAQLSRAEQCRCPLPVWMYEELSELYGTTIDFLVKGGK